MIAIRKTWWIAALVPTLALLALACSSTPAPKPLPGGPPPEYEAPRAFDAGIELANPEGQAAPKPPPAAPAPHP